MKVLVIEDERRAANRLIKMIRTYDTSIEILDRLESVKNTITWFGDHPMPDLIFMDIQLGDGLCFEIFDECNLMAPVIFTTAYDQFAIKAFKFYSIDYLLKPVSFSELKAAIDKYFIFKQNLSVAQVYNQTISLLRKPVKDRFIIKVGESINTVKIEEISLIGSKDKYTYLYKSDNKKFIIDYTLEQLEVILDTQRFFRINRTYIVNRNSIIEIKTYVNSRLVLKLSIPYDQSEIIVSRERVADFKKWLEK
ncbi:MAG: response regulator transcription factor [Sporocytophaga sp.]|uniref:LytR/AlgR family response regulator transcription factor n=1 Tax=Sporocytophaga sp. TaxID=2231183 RepID=UPI001B138B34|nr:LytTR family DNA-binding domain-containing protein [Sporocytophaga sp.]MBO9703005.1 response regulator transcription factor [Sporocytophaga sp.]